MKFKVTNRWTGAVQFTAEIECDESASTSIKLGLAVRWAVKAGAYLAGAYLAGADLAGANLAGAYLAGANLAGAYLDGADLAGAYLAGAYLAGADLAGANLAGADLAGAYLAGAYLDGAYLAGAYLAGANLAGANLYGANGINDWIKCIQIDDYPITYTAEVMQIGCQRHTLAEWSAFDDDAILRMDGRRALSFWRKWKAWIFQTIEMAPAQPMNPAPAAANPEAQTAA